VKKGEIKPPMESKSVKNHCAPAWKQFRHITSHCQN
jgi:hypothetical protein